MIKSKLIERIHAQNTHLYLRDVEKAIGAMLGEIAAALERGDRVELRGFGVFSVRCRAARQGRNPSTGAPVAVQQKRLPFFKIGRELHRRINREKQQG